MPKSKAQDIRANAKKLNPAIAIMLDRERHLKFGLRALRAIEEKTGRSALGDEFWKDKEPSTEDFITLIWAGLLHEDKELTIDQVIDLVDEYSSIPELLAALTKAYKVAMPEPEKPRKRAKKAGEAAEEAAPLA